MNLNEWAVAWGVPFAAVEDLRRRMGLDDAPPPPEVAGKSEAAVQASLRLAAAKAGGRLWRNNVGAGYMDDGTFLRFGLANDSAAVNKVCKSADLIGIKPVVVTPAHVGTTLGQFWSREVKAPGWRYTGTDREKGQLAWANLILSLGGDAGFSTANL